MAVSEAVSQLFGNINDELARRLPKFHKARREGVALLVALLLSVRSVNLMELAEALPRKIGKKDHRYQFIARILANPHIVPDEIIKPFAQEVFSKLTGRGQTLVLMMDQSKINDLNEVLMVSVRIRKRAIPVAWRVRQTNGNIGFETQKELLDVIRDWIPQGVKVMLAADRFYGTEKLIKWCQQAGWGYRIRLKGNLTLQHQGGELTTGEAVGLMGEGLENAELYGSGVITNIGILHEKGHPEPWIVAMDAKPGKYKVLDYGLRWGIEPMFSDGKSRGFGVGKSHIERPDKMEKLFLIIALAMYWAVSCGTYDEWKNEYDDRACDNQKSEKNGGDPPAHYSQKACDFYSDV